jgi:hypothetical protein
VIAFLTELSQALPSEIADTDTYPGIWTLFVKDGALYGEQTMCGWFAMCSREASGYVLHPVLGAVPVCSQCAERAS